MQEAHRSFAELWDALRARLGDRIEESAIPPPVFTAMRGEFVEHDLDAGTLTTRFPVLDSYLNPYGTMQGGMVAAAVDNTLGPLSMLVAPPNVTHRLEMTYSRPITLETGYIFVTARLLEQTGRRLRFRADVHDAEGRRVARAKATHWIVDES